MLKFTPKIGKNITVLTIYSHNININVSYFTVTTITLKLQSFHPSQNREIGARFLCTSVTRMNHSMKLIKKTISLFYL